MALEQPVVLFFFNRPKHLQRVFARVRQAQPSDLVLVSDGPRPGRPGEAEACDACRAVVEQVDWPCRVTKCYAEDNMGCRDRIASGIREAFERYETAIFLEDDCLPTLGFFAYCDELLRTYASNEAVGFISGTRFIRLPRPKGNESYQFCQMPLVWGWASWRRALVGYDETMADREAQRASIQAKLEAATAPLGPSLGNRLTQSILHTHNNCALGKIDTWDHPLAYHLLKNDRNCVIPRQNMVINTGLGPSSTHSAEIPNQATLRSYDPPMPLNHPASTQPDPMLNALVWKHCFMHPMLGEPGHKRLIHRIKRSIEESLFRRRESANA